ncbi:hypothetical protein AC1031_007822 [Aphanomyces cochlioides]|nr:hypothetical protein AC1031_007822 [Aphanomyces cochlioides]
MSAIRVYVGGIPKSAGNREIEEAFQRFGKIVNVWIARNPPGFAFVDFEDPRDADDAIKDMDGKELLGERIRVQMARGGVRRGGRDDRDRSYRDGSSDRRTTFLTSSYLSPISRSFQWSQSPRHWTSAQYGLAGREGFCAQSWRRLLL